MPLFEAVAVAVVVTAVAFTDVALVVDDEVTLFSAPTGSAEGCKFEQSAKARVFPPSSSSPAILGLIY